LEWRRGLRYTMVGHEVAPFGMSTQIRTPFGEFTSCSTADFFVRYVYDFKTEKVRNFDDSDVAKLFKIFQQDEKE
jgi:hypothetical protein